MRGERHPTPRRVAAAQRVRGHRPVVAAAAPRVGGEGGAIAGAGAAEDGGVACSVEASQLASKVSVNEVRKCFGVRSLESGLSYLLM